MGAGANSLHMSSSITLSDSGFIWMTLCTQTAASESSFCSSFLTAGSPFDAIR